MNPILIIDDDAGVRGVLKMMLERAGYPVVAAGSGDEGLRFARENRPSLAIVDIEMPGMNGYDVCTMMKTDPSLRTVPVIVMTGRPLAGVNTRVQATGAIDFWPKPFERGQVLRRVAAILGDEAGRAGKT